METIDSRSPLSKVDHLIYGTPDLEATLEELEDLFGIQASPGGQHLGEGTRNALYSLGPNTYLEILAPDPDQPPPEKPRWLGMDDLTEPRLVTWVARATNLDQLVLDAAKETIHLGSVLAGGRTRPDGTRLSWHVTDPHVVIASGIVPFFIDWGDTSHPSQNAAQGLALTGLRAEHPEARATRRALCSLSLDLVVEEGPMPALIATIDTPRGTVELG